MVWRLRGADGVDGDANVAVGPVFETNGTRQAGGQFAVHLRLGRARPDCPPSDQVSSVLRGDGIEELGRAGQSEFIDFEQ